MTRYRNPELDPRPWLDLAGGLRALIVGDPYASGGRGVPAPVGVYDRLTRGLWVRAGLQPPLRRDIALWSLTGLAHALRRDPALVRAALLSEPAGGARGYRRLSLPELRSWCEAGEGARSG